MSYELLFFLVFIKSFGNWIFLVWILEMIIKYLYEIVILLYYYLKFYFIFYCFVKWIKCLFLKGYMRDNKIWNYIKYIKMNVVFFIYLLVDIINKFFFVY